MIRIALPNNVLTVTIPYDERLLSVLRALDPVYGLGEQTVNKWQFKPESLLYILSALEGHEFTLSDSALQLKTMLEGARTKSANTIIPAPPGLNYYPFQNK